MANITAKPRKFHKISIVLWNIGTGLAIYDSKATIRQGEPDRGIGRQMKWDQTSDALPPGEDGTRSQCAALCWRMHRGRVEVLLITSRDTGRWVIPKGWPMPGKSAAQSAIQEAWEEAGVRGKGQDRPVGQYGYFKIMADKSALPCVVTVYPLRVKELASRYPERKQRRRRWHDAEDAAKLVAEPELRALFLRLAEAPALLKPSEAAAAIVAVAAR